MFVWHDFMHWPFRYYFTQIAITLAIVFAGTLTATVLALLLSFFAARNIMRGVVPGVALLMRRLFDVLRGIDMAIWGLILSRGGPWAAGRGAGDHHAGHRIAGAAVRGRTRGGGPLTGARADRRGRERPAKASLWHFYPVVPDLSVAEPVSD
jgi:hypothetical protein